ncbi:MAG: hypothetical protein ACYTAS_17520 [Planctomycetota bacterium]
MDSENTPGKPEEQEAVFSTINGGGQPASGARACAIPRGVEVLLKKASVDPEFRKLLLEQRGEAARIIDLELTDAEREMLAHIPVEQLEQIINNTKVKPEHRLIFLGVVGALMLAAVAIGIDSCASDKGADWKTTLPLWDIQWRTFADDCCRIGDDTRYRGPCAALR